MAGNPNPTGGKPDKVIRDALKAAIRQSPQKLKKAAERVLDDAAEGNLASMQFLADRIDGRAIQPIAHSMTEEQTDESQIDAAITELAGKIGFVISAKEEALPKDEAELPNVH